MKIGSSNASFVNPALVRFAENLISFPKATDSLENGIYTQTKEFALTRRYIGLNHRLAFYIAVDIDRPGAADTWEDCNLAPPTITTVNPSNGHAHLLWELCSPVPVTSNARSKPIEYFDAVRSAITKKLRGDAAYAGYITKNPMNNHWYVIANDRRYELAELSEYVDLESNFRRMRYSEVGRNSTLFESLRFWAYRSIQDADSFLDWQWQCERAALGFNSFDAPLPINEVRTVARSVSKWTWKNRVSLAGNSKGCMGLEPLEENLAADDYQAEVYARQAAGARHVHQKRRSKSELAITAAANRLGMSIPELRDRDAIAIATAAGIGINTVRRFISRIQACYKKQ